MNIIKNKKIIYIIVAIIFSAIFLLIFSSETSPIRNSCFGDSANYKLEGILTRKGRTPYVDFFEHKGPLIFVIQALGCLVTYNRIGIYIVEVIFFTVSLCGGYKICRLYFNEKQSILMILIITFVNEIFRASNLTEEYSMPFLIWSTYFITKYFVEEKKNCDYNIKYAFFNGISVMACILIRMTNALPICLLIFAGLVDLVIKKKWKNIFNCIISFLLGMLLMLVPFVVWFASKGALYDMFYGTIIHNIKYTTNVTETLINCNIECIYVFCIEFIIAIIGCIYSFVVNIEKRKYTVIVLISSVVGMICELGLRPYSHYIYIWLPIFVLGDCIFINALINDKENKLKIVKILIKSINIINVLILIAFLIPVAKRKVIINTQPIIDMENDARQINSMIPKESKKKVLAYNVNSQFYITTNIIPFYKYFILQDWMCSVNDEMQEEFKEYIESGQAEYIVENGENNIYNENDGTDNDLDYIIDEKYEEIGRNDSFVLMKRK